MGMTDDATPCILSSSSGGEQFSAQLPTITRGVCDEQIARHRNALHGRKRLEMRKARSTYPLWVEQMTELRKADKAVKAAIGEHVGRKHQNGLVMDSIGRKTREVIGDKGLIHKNITDVLWDHYAMPLDFNNKLHNAPNWEPYATAELCFLILKHSEIGC